MMVKSQLNNQGCVPRCSRHRGVGASTALAHGAQRPPRDGNPWGEIIGKLGYIRIIVVVIQLYSNDCC
jgi:hypothetical protein